MCVCVFAHFLYVLLIFLSHCTIGRLCCAREACDCTLQPAPGYVSIDLNLLKSRMWVDFHQLKGITRDHCAQAERALLGVNRKVFTLQTAAGC